MPRTSTPTSSTSRRLADRAALRRELEGLDAETYLVEVKAAAIDVVVLAKLAQAVIGAVVVHEHVDLLAGARGSKAAGMRDTRREGGDEARR